MIQSRKDFFYDRVFVVLLPFPKGLKKDPYMVVAGLNINDLLDGSDFIIKVYGIVMACIS